MEHSLLVKTLKYYCEISDNLSRQKTIQKEDFLHIQRGWDDFKSKIPSGRKYSESINAIILENKTSTMIIIVQILLIIPRLMLKSGANIFVTIMKTNKRRKALIKFRQEV